MFRREARLASVAAAVITLVSGTLVMSGNAAASSQPDNAGPDSCSFITALFQHNPLPMKNAARIIKTDCGYRYRAGQQDSHLVITQVGNKLRFVDRKTDRIDAIPRTCKRIKGVRGIAAECRIGTGFSVNHRMLVEVWPRLGDDFVDGSSLSAMFSLSVLGDGGNDTALLGAGPDFFNGAFGNDTVRGGSGNDWLRTGDQHDRIISGPGNDFITGGIGSDYIDGGDGADKLYCGPGVDKAILDGADSKVVYCESRIFR
jgi:serralysin